LRSSPDEDAQLTVAAPPSPSTPRDDFLGHPKGLTFLFATEMWERFSYYGMRALLVLYMMKYLLQRGTVDTVLGFSGLRTMLEAIFGPLDPQPLASQIYGFYTGFVYLTPIFGGLLADRLLGLKRTVVLGALLMAIGHFMMAFDSLFLFALLALILGNGCFKPNISSQVGDLYRTGDRRRDRAYSIFYVGINLGAFFSPLVCGTLGEEVGWHYGFAAAGVGMLVSLAVYLFGTRHLPPDRRIEKATQGKQHLTREEWRTIGALLLISVFVTFFFATYEQQGNTIALWADNYTDRTIDLFGWRTEIPTTWFQAFNPFMIFAFTPFVVALWAQQSKRRTEPSSIIKMAIGCFGITAGNIVMIVAAILTGPGDKASWLWLFGYFTFVTLGELYLSPIGLSLFSKIAPRSLLSMMMGIWLATSFTGNFIAGWLGSFWSGMEKSMFFAMIAAISAAAGLAILVISKPLIKQLNKPQ
jgi:POT family proton-dependent oligopeptide transporter